MIAVALLLIALPQYGQASGRSCGNCHISPTYQDPAGWTNPELSKRKCNLSCIACHINPTGGGLRNTSGRYFGQSTLSMFPLQERSYSDYQREVLPQELIRAVRDQFLWKPDTSGPHTIPSSWTEVEAGVGSGQNGGFASWGTPLFGKGEYSLWDGRYGDLIADPLVQLGADLRFAYFSPNQSFFPMQIDLHAAVQPIEHVTALATLAARGRASGIAATIDQEQLPVFLKDAILLVHELPFSAYAKAGLFLPPFGTHIDDHTSYIRDYFELDVSQPHDQVLGVELGAAPNYPFTSIAFFRNLSLPGGPEDADPGWGGSAQIGWRDLWFSIQAHGMIKRRDLAARGDMEAGGLAFSFNPFYFSNSVPLTYLGEVSFGRHQRELTGSSATFVASYHELWITIFNGINARLKYDVGDRDLSSAGELEHRLSGALDLSVYPGFTIIAQGRILFVDQSKPSPDVFVQLHLWF